MAYHDDEWGVPVRDPLKLFEFLILEGMQAGLSWRTILHKREHMRQVFAGFVPLALARFTQAKIDKLLHDPGIIRNTLKVNAVITNAKAYLQLHKKGTPFVDFLWQFTDGNVIVNNWRSKDSIPTTSVEAKAMSKALKAAGFKFVGETICYALMQAVGMVNDHVTTCFRYRELT